MNDNLTQRFDGQANGEKLNQILAIVQSLDTRVESLDTRVQSLDTRLGSLEDKVERRLYDTRPIWEKVQTDIAQLQANSNHLQSDVNELKLGQEFLRSESHEIHTLLRDIFRRLSIFNDTLVTMQADYRGHLRSSPRHRTPANLTAS